MRRLKVNVDKQSAELWEGSKKVASYVISTAKNGLGCEIGSYCTPTGKLRVAQKIGDGAPLGRIFKTRVDTGKDWPLFSSNISDNQGRLAECRVEQVDATFQDRKIQSVSDDDLVLTRILWLEGAEPHNSNTLYRHIYLHGTNQEHLLGKPVSHGCIRFSNTDIVDVFNLMTVGDEVEIV